MTSRVIFLDFDGTYSESGLVPPGHATAVRAARSAGHRVFLCTGRPKSMISDHALEAGFDGLVATAGGYVEVRGEVLVDRRFPGEVAARVLAVLDANDVAYLLEAPEAVHGRPGVAERLQHTVGEHYQDKLGSGGPQDLLVNLSTAEDLSGVRFSKVTLFDSAVPVASLAAAIGDDVGLLPSSVRALGDSAGELFQPGVHKAAGMQRVIEHLGLAREDVVAFGDGPNDLEMLQYAGLGVAIEGAHPDLLAVADSTAAGPEREGLAEAFAALGLT